MKHASSQLFFHTRPREYLVKLQFQTFLVQNSRFNVTIAFTRFRNMFERTLVLVHILHAGAGRRDVIVRTESRPRTSGDVFRVLFVSFVRRFLRMNKPGLHPPAAARHPLPEHKALAGCSSPENSSCPLDVPLFSGLPPRTRLFFPDSSWSSSSSSSSLASGSPYALIYRRTGIRLALFYSVSPVKGANENRAFLLYKSRSSTLMMSFPRLAFQSKVTRPLPIFFPPAIFSLI